MGVVSGATIHIKALNNALKAARKLFEAGYSQEAISILAELVAAIAQSPTLRRSLPPAFVAVLNQFAPAALGFLSTRPMTQNLPDVLRAITTASAAPARTAFDRFWRQGVAAPVSFERVQREGLKMVESGHPEGLSMIGASSRISGTPLPFKRMETVIAALPEREIRQGQSWAAEAVAHSAYAFESRGSFEPAVRLGAIAPALASSSSDTGSVAGMWRELYSNPISKIRTNESERGAALEMGQVLLEKGYPTEATQLQIDAMRLEPEDYSGVWKTIDEAIRQTPGVKQPVSRSSRRPPSPHPPKHPEFYFILEGEKVKGNQVVFGSDFDLVFNYDDVPEDALAVTHGSELDKQRQRPNGRFDIVIMLTGCELREDGNPYGTARFQEGKLIEPVRFQLRTAQAGTPKGRIDVSFTVRGAKIYDCPLDLDLVETIDVNRLVRQPLDIDLDELAATDREIRDANLTIDDVGGSWHVTFSQISQPEPLAKQITDFNSEKLATELGPIHELLKQVAENPIWKNVTADLKAPRNSAGLRKMMGLVVNAGSRLYKIFAKTQLSDIIKTIDALPDGSKISVSTKTAFVPWEIMFPLSYNEDWGDSVPQRSANFQPKKLWGNRFEIEVLVASEKSQPSPRPRQPGPISVTMALGKTIAPDSETATAAVQWQEDYFKNKLAAFGNLLSGKAQIEQIFVAPDYPATFIYLLCHGQSKNAAKNTDDVLEFEKNYKVTPDMLITGNCYSRRPIVFLNSCSSGAISPLSFTSFLTEFRTKQAFGLLAASFPIPTRFAAAFGQKVLDGYLKQERLGRVLLTARQELLEKQIPLGLFYTLQCPLDAQGPQKVSP